VRAPARRVFGARGADARQTAVGSTRDRASGVRVPDDPSVAFPGLPPPPPEIRTRSTARPTPDPLAIRS